MLEVGKSRSKSEVKVKVKLESRSRSWKVEVEVRSRVKVVESWEVEGGPSHGRSSRVMDGEAPRLIESRLVKARVDRVMSG